MYHMYASSTAASTYRVRHGSPKNEIKTSLSRKLRLLLPVYPRPIYKIKDGLIAITMLAAQDQKRVVG